MENDFTIALSEKEGEDALKEVSLNIKSTFLKSIKYLLLFFTPHYQPQTVLKTMDFTLKPHLMVGIQAPFIIFEDKIIEKGVVACCINKERVELKEVFIKSSELSTEAGSDLQAIEKHLRKYVKNLPPGKCFLLFCLSHQLDPSNYLKALLLSWGKIFNILGSGFVRRYATKNYQITSDTADEGFLNILGKGLDVNFINIRGYLPIGKPFTITRIRRERNIIMEIDNQPAINTYKRYLEEKFDLFRKNNLFPLYPLGIKHQDELRLVNVINCLDDGSLVCIGDIKEKYQAHIMLFNQPLLFKSLKDQLQGLRAPKEELVLIINSLTRKKILKDSAIEEIRLIKNLLGDKSKIFGMYSDYSIFTNEKTRKVEWETGNLLMARIK